MDSRITSDPSICSGKPCIAGTRMRVSDVLELLAAGASFDEIVEDYAYLSLDDIKACLSYAAHHVAHPTIVTAIAAE